MERKERIRQLQRQVIAWFKRNGRKLPWRGTTDPYAIVVSEIMLQQTQVDRVIPKWRAFLERFPTWEALAVASQSDVVKMWHGLGYNRRALGLHALAKAVVERGGLPSEPAQMQKLPGIGPYTANAVAAFAFRRKGAAPVDTNIDRILRRVFGLYGASEKEIEALAREIAPRDVWSFNHGLMDIGATICTARSPKCESCPLKNICVAYPCTGKEIVKRGQGTFKDSDRQYRGRIISLLRENNLLRRNSIGSAIGLSDPERLEKILAGLVREGFIQIRGGKIVLAA